MKQLGVTGNKMKIGDLVKYVWGSQRLHGIIVGEEDASWNQPIWKVWTGERILTFYESNLRVV